MSTTALNRLRVLRAERRKSQMQVAADLQISHNRYWRIENGWAEPTPEEKAALAQYFGKPESDIFTSEAA